MKNIISKIVIISVLLFSFFFIAVVKSKKMQHLTLNNIEALATDENEDEEEIVCIGIGNLDCDGKNYKYFVDIE